MPDSLLGHLHHVGVAVRDIKAAAARFEAMLGADLESDIIHDPLQGVRAQFLTVGGLRIELLEPAADPSPLDSVLKRGIALYHTCHEVSDLDATLARLTASGVRVVSPPKPAIAFANRRVAFIICQGMIIELLEEGIEGPRDRETPKRQNAKTPKRQNAKTPRHRHGGIRNRQSPIVNRQSLAVLDEVHAEPTVINITRAARLLIPHRETLADVSLRLACLSSFTFDPIEPALALQGLRSGFALELYRGPFGQVEQELIDPASGLASFKPDAVLLAVRLQDVCPAIYEASNSLSADQAARLIDDWMNRLRAALLAFRQHSAAHLLVQNYDSPAAPALGIADRASPLSQTATIARANEALAALAASIENVHLMDYDALVARHGRETWQDQRLALYARMPVAAKHHWDLAGFYLRHLRPLYGLCRKVLVLDADNTLWGGVVGDIGVDAIALGLDFPGNAYLTFQKRILDLHRRGVILCLASKNEPGTVEEVFDKHPQMVLRAEHFAAMRVNWDPKPQNLQRLAADLNLGLDSFVFVDDSAVECELMRATLPRVMTIHLPPDPAGLPAVIESLDCFDQWTVSREDRKRGKLYKAQAARKEMQATAVDMPTFYHRLRMRMTLYVDHVPHIGRASQMTNRTNQFNMHTIRCSEDDIRRFITAADHQVVTVALEDRFGDNGVVGLAVVRLGQEEWNIRILLMSCRILGRTVEQAFVAWIADRARAAGAGRLVAEFVPTAKNRPFAGFYKDQGFSTEPPVTQAGTDDEVQRSCGTGVSPVGSRWVLPLAEVDTNVPQWIDVAVTEDTRA